MAIPLVQDGARSAPVRCRHSSLCCLLRVQVVVEQAGLSTEMVVVGAWLKSWCGTAEVQLGHELRAY